jgi:hypothetical protein
VIPPNGHLLFIVDETGRLDETADYVSSKAAFSRVFFIIRDEMVEVRLKAATPAFDAFVIKKVKLSL